MKTALLVASAAALVLAGSLYVCRTRTEAEPSSARPAETPAAKPADPSKVELERARPETTSAPSAAKPESRTAASTPSARVPDDAGAPPPLVDLGSVETAGSIEAARAGEYENFAKKYQSSSAKDRLRARTTIEGLLYAHKSGTETKAEALTDQQFVELGHEVDWLQAHPAP